MRYHKKVYYPITAEAELTKLCKKLNIEKWQYSRHCIDNLKYRELNLQKLLLYVKDIILIENDIFEFYTENDIINKICLRLSYTDNQDIILIISNEKNIISIYLNDKKDNHITLNKNLYIQS